MKPGLVILSTNFGSNFSGGCRVTHEIVSRLEDQFGQIIFVGSRVGENNIRNLIFIKSRTWVNTYFILRKLKKFNNIFYGDFYNAILLALAKTKYVFTYHDNWPELAELDFRHKILNAFYIRLYRHTFNHASRLITVSEYKKTVIKQLTHTTIEVIPNGFDQSGSSSESVKKKGILMVGNIDQRKYQLAINLFSSLDPVSGLKIDIYGHCIDQSILRKLVKFSFVNLKGFHQNIPFQSYSFLLHTSFIESFGMVFLEAISQGVPVLTFDRGGAKEIVNKDSGMLIEPYQIGSMRDALYELLGHPMKANAGIAKKYSWEKAAARYSKIFRELK